MTTQPIFPGSLNLCAASDAQPRDLSGMVDSMADARRSLRKAIAALHEAARCYGNAASKARLCDHPDRARIAEVSGRLAIDEDRLEDLADEYADLGR